MSNHNGPRGRRVPPPPPPPVPSPLPPPLPVSETDEAPVAESHDQEEEIAQPQAATSRPKIDRQRRATSPRARSRRIALLFNSVMHIAAPLLGLALGWYLLGKIRPELSPAAMLSDQRQVALLSEIEQPQQLEPSTESLPSHQGTKQQTASSRREDDHGPAAPGPARHARELAAGSGATAAAPVAPRLLSDLLPKPEPIDSLPSAIDLPPLGQPGTTILAQLELGEEKPCALSLISSEIPGREGQRLALAPDSSTATPQIWTVRALQPNDDTAVTVAEFLWNKGRLMFRWRYAADRELRTALVNSMVNLSIDTREQRIQLRTPVQTGGLPLDLTQRRLASACDFHHLPPLHRLRVTVTAVDLQEELECVVDEQQRTAAPGRKIPINITTSPGVKFDAWLGTSIDKLAFYVEGHYRPAGFPPLLFTQQKVETQYRTFHKQRVEAINRLPLLQRSLARTQGELRRAEGQLRAARNIPDRNAAQTTVNLFTLQRDTINANIVRTQVEIPMLAQRMAAIQEVGVLGNRIHDRAVVQYRVHLPLEHEGTTYDVVLMETSGRSATPAHALARTFSAEPADRIPVPSAEEIAATAALLKVEFGQRYAAAEDADARRELAEALVQQAGTTTQDLPRQFELLRSATRILAPLDVAAALEVADQIEQLFDVQRLALRGPILVRAAGAGDRPSDVIQAILELVDESVQSPKDHSTARQLLSLAKSLAGSLPDNQLAQQVQQRIDSLELAANN